MATLRVLKWVGIITGLWIVVGLGISLFLPFPYSLPVVIIVGCCHSVYDKKTGAKESIAKRTRKIY